MTTYKEIFGKPVKFLGTDPSNAEAEGQIWYNSTSGSFKSVVVGESFSSASPLGTARYALARGTTGTQNSALAAFGRLGPATGATEEYNGSGWSTGGTANTARYGVGGFGTTSAFVGAGGNPVQQTVEEYNGSTWTTVTSFPTAARAYLSGFGIESAGAVFGGGSATPVDTVFDLTEEYNGSAWTAGGTLNTGGSRIASTGTLTAGIAASRVILPFNTASGATEEYNGTSWTSTTSMNTARYSADGFGTQTAMVVSGGTPSPTATETWDGSTWTTSTATLGTGRNSHSAGGDSGSAGLVFGGNPPGIGNTEEYNKSASVITSAAWASGGNLTTARSNIAGSGTQTAGLATGGTTPSLTTATEEYNGSAWTAGGAYPTPVTQASGFGIQTASIVCGGDSPGSPVANPGAITSQTTSYNGSTWTQVNPMTQARYNTIGGGCGTQTAGLIAGGDDGITSPSDDLSAVEEYDGTSWTAATSLTTARGGGGINIGTQTAAIVAYGTNPAAGGPPSFSTWFEDTEIYNGSVWTAGPKTNTLRRSGVGASGTLTNGLAFGGYFNPVGAIDYTEKYDGTSWATQPVLSTARYAIGGASNGTADAALGMGGYTTTFVATTEEFTGETSALNFKTLTTS